MQFELDQHMMTDKKIIKKIVSFAGIKSCETVLEIGAGSGNLTRELAKKSNHVIAVEIDKKFESRLKEIKNTKVIIGNVLKEIKNLKFDKIVSNIPYAVCEPLFQKLPFCEFRLAVLTVPKKFAYRLLSKKTKLGLIMHEFFEIKILLDVPKTAFEPPPNTNSVVILLKFRRKKTLLSVVFSQPKSKIKNAIMRALFFSRKMTKNQARKHLKTLELNNKLLEKKVIDTDLEDIKALKKAL